MTYPWKTIKLFWKFCHKFTQTINYLLRTVVLIQKCQRKTPIVHIYDVIFYLFNKLLICGQIKGPMLEHKKKTSFNFANFYENFIFLFSDKLAVIIIGIVTLILGIILSSIPWLDYFILKVNNNCRNWNLYHSYSCWFYFSEFKAVEWYLKFSLLAATGCHTFNKSLYL